MKKTISPIIAAIMIALVIKKVVVVIIALHILVVTVLVVYTTAMLCLCRKPRPFSRHASHRSYWAILPFNSLPLYAPSPQAACCRKYPSPVKSKWPTTIIPLFGIRQPFASWSPARACRCVSPHCVLLWFIHYVIQQPLLCFPQMLI